MSLSTVVTHSTTDLLILDKIRKELISINKIFTNFQFNTTIVVPYFSNLPNPADAQTNFYWVENSQGTKWLPWNLGGTYYPKGLYYSNGTAWSHMDTPYQATQQ
jgi:hypothetical protein